VTVSEKNPSTGKTSTQTVTLSASTTYTVRSAGSSSDLVVGKCAQATGTTGSTGTITASSITVSTPTSSGCSSGFGGFGGGGGASA
jgi:hypothetical protein